MKYTLAKQVLKGLAKLRIPVLLNGSTGVGKTSLVREVASEFGLPLIDIRLSTELPENIGGIPRLDTEFFVKVLNKDLEPAFTTGAVLFFDELNRSSSWTRNSIMSAFFERTLGGRPLSENTIVVGAVNTGDRFKDADTLDDALLGRFAIINLDPDVNELTDYFSRKYPLATALFSTKSGNIFNLLEIQYERLTPIACPRTIEFALKVIENYISTEEKDLLREMLYCIVPGNIADLLLSEVDFSLIRKILKGEKVEIEKIENPTLILAVLSHTQFKNENEILNAIDFAKKVYERLDLKDSFVAFLKAIAKPNSDVFMKVFPSLIKSYPEIKELLQF